MTEFNEQETLQQSGLEEKGQQENTGSPAAFGSPIVGNDPGDEQEETSKEDADQDESPIEVDTTDEGLDHYSTPTEPQGDDTHAEDGGSQDSSDIEEPDSDDREQANDDEENEGEDQEVPPVIDRKFEFEAINPVTGKRYTQHNAILLCAKDAAVLPALKAYLKECERIGCAPEHTESLRMLIQRVEEYQTLIECRVPDTVGDEIQRCIKGEGL